MEIADDPVCQTAPVQIDAPNGLVRQDVPEPLVADRAAERKSFQLFPHGVEQRIGAELNGIALVVHADQVTQPAGLNQRDQLQLAHVVIRRRDICLYRLSEADRQLLRGIRRDALGGIGYETSCSITFLHHDE